MIILVLSVCASLSFALSVLRFHTTPFHCHLPHSHPLSPGLFVSHFTKEILISNSLPKNQFTLGLKRRLKPTEFSPAKSQSNLYDACEYGNISLAQPLSPLLDDAAPLLSLIFFLVVPHLFSIACSLPVFISCFFCEPLRSRRLACMGTNGSYLLEHGAS